MKDPAFLFYSSDFLMGVSGLTMEERGQYITILCMQHQKGRLTKKSIGIAVPNAAADVMAKFTIDEDGLYYNERLEKEAIKRSEHGEKQRQRALSGWEKRRATADATALPLEDEDVIEDISISKEENEEELIFPFQSQQFVTAWNNWRYYKDKEHRFTYKTVASKQAALMKINKLSDGNEETAIKIINESMANGWKGFFKLNNDGGNTKKGHDRLTEEEKQLIISRKDL